MKHLSILTIAICVLVVKPAVRAASLITEYWPMHSGDIRYYTGPAGRAYVEVETAFDWPYDFNLYEYDREAEDYSWSASGGFGYSGDTVLEHGAEVGWNNYYWEPPLPVLTESALASGGTRTFRSELQAPGPNYAVTVTISIANVGTVTVPAGTYHNCRTVQVTARLAGDGRVVTAEAWTLAPKVGQIRIGVANGAGQLVGWQVLTGGTVGGVKVRDLANQVPPVVAITSPRANQRVSNEVVTVQGTARDNISVARVWYQVNGGAPQAATTANGWTNWSATVAFPPGTNTVTAYAEDGRSNRSPVASVRFIRVLTAPLNLEVRGEGAVTPYAAGQLLEIGRRYTLVATPRTGHVFSNWTGSFVSWSNTLSFVMASNLIFEANIVPNPFLRVAGAYNGLFLEPANTRHESSGFLGATLRPNGTFSAYIRSGTKRHPFSGRFNLEGRATNMVLRPGTNALTVELSVDLHGGDLISGRVTGGAWESELTADRAVFHARTNPATNFAQRYTLLLPGGTNGSVSQPAGHGFQALNISRAGIGAFTGALADGSPAALSVPVSKHGDVPWYLPLYGGRGSAFGWMRVGGGPVSGVTGQVAWFRPPKPQPPLYTNGFVHFTEVIGSVYEPYGTNRMLNLDSAIVRLADGGLAEPLTNTVTLTPGGRVTHAGPHKLTLKVAPTTGLFTGSLVPVGTTSPIPIRGVLVREQGFGGGFFIRGGQSGSVYLGP